MPPALERRPGSGDLALVASALCFGGTFVVVQEAIEDVEPIPFLALRFAVGTLALAPFALRRPVTPGLWRDGVGIGLALLAGFVLQTVGLQYTDTATSAFLTYLLVVLVPVIGFVAFGRRPHRMTLAAIGLAVVGLALLTGVGTDGGMGRGEALTIGCAVAFAVQVVLLGQWAARHDPLRLATVQIAVVAVACAVPGFFLGGYGFSAAAAGGAVATGLVSSAGGFALQTFGQQRVPPARASLLLLLETVFAAVLAELVGEDRTALEYVGAGVILAAVVVGELGPGWLDRRVRAREAEADNGRSQGGLVG